MCGIAAALLAGSDGGEKLDNCMAAQLVREALLMLQHRGQDAAGIVTSDERGFLHLRKSNGLVAQVFAASEDVQDLVGRVARKLRAYVIFP